MSQLQTTEGEDLSLRRQVRRFLDQHTRVERIGRGLLFHLTVAVPLEALLKWLGCPTFCAVLAAVSASLYVESVCLIEKAKDTDG